MSFTAVCYRAVGYEAPLWSFPNTVAGRYNLANAWPAQYLALHPMTPWAEQLRNLDLRTAAQARSARLPLWALRIHLGAEPVRIGFPEARDHGVQPDDLVDDDYGECQRLAGELRNSGVTSVIVPSAALPGTENLVLFEPAVVIDYHQEPIDPVDVPAALTSQEGRCPEGLWEQVHFRNAGVMHPGLQAYHGGSRYEFVQPAVTVVALRSG